MGLNWSAGLQALSQGLLQLAAEQQRQQELKDKEAMDKLRKRLYGYQIDKANADLKIAKQKEYEQAHPEEVARRQAEAEYAGQMRLANLMAPQLLLNNIRSGVAPLSPKEKLAGQLTQAQINRQNALTQEAIANTERLKNNPTNTKTATKTGINAIPSTVLSGFQSQAKSLAKDAVDRYVESIPPDTTGGDNSIIGNLLKAPTLSPEQADSLRNLSTNVYNKTFWGLVNNWLAQGKPKGNIVPKATNIVPQMLSAHSKTGVPQITAPKAKSSSKGWTKDDDEKLKRLMDKLGLK